MKTKLRNLTRWLIVFAIAFDAAFLLQKLGGAYDSEFGAHPDEAAHYVTGLFVRDAIKSLPSCAAQRSAAPLKAFGPSAPGGFYEHYPKVALGVWPPFFYLVQSAWTLPFGESRMSVLLLMASLAAGVATLIYGALRREFGMLPAAAAALLWLCGPLAREYYGMIMAETLGTLTMLGATLFWGRFLDDGRKRDAVLFALLASAAIMTKGSGLALVLMCAFSLLLVRRWKLLTKPALWIAVVMVVVLAGPWTWFFRKEGTRVGGWEDNSGGISWSFTSQAVPYYFQKMSIAIGIAVAVFALIGIVTRARSNGRWAAVSSLVIGILTFQSLIPVGYEARHILPATAALVLLAVAGIFTIARLRALRVEGAEQQKREYLWIVLLLLLTLPFAFMHREQKGYSGFRPIASELLKTAQPGSRILVSSDARGEGMFISEIAMRDKRPNLTIERASKALVDPKGRTWDGKNLREKYSDDEQLLAFFTGGKIEYIVLDDALPEEKRAGYHDQLRRVINDNTGTFIAVAETPIIRENEPLIKPLRLYRVVRKQ